MHIPKESKAEKAVRWRTGGAHSHCEAVPGWSPDRWESVQAAGENAEEELAALLEESGASMHTQKESRAEKAAWWRTRIALDGRLQHLCAALQARLGPWL